VVRWGRSLTANETASLKTSRLTWNFMAPLAVRLYFYFFGTVLLREVNTGTARSRANPRVISPHSIL
jgi:hypothetical protein